MKTDRYDYIVRRFDKRRQTLLQDCKLKNAVKFCKMTHASKMAAARLHMLAEIYLLIQITFTSALNERIN